MFHSSFRFLCVMFALGAKPVHNFAETATVDHSPEKTLAEIRKSKPQLADEFERRLKQSQSEIDTYKRGHVIFGRIVLDGGNDPRAVTSQMIVLEDGYFVDAIGAVNAPIGFRLHGYESVDVIPKGPGPTENVGVVRLKRLPAKRLASAKGRLQIESRPGAPRPDQIDVSWSVSANPINTPSNGTEGYNPLYVVPIKSKVSSDGTFSLSALSPTQYYLSVAAPNSVSQWRLVDFSEGETKQLDPIPVEVIRKMNVEYAVSPNGHFQGATISKTTLAANDRWRVNEDTPQYAFDLAIGQKDGRLLLGYSYAPCYITELGAAQLSEKLGVGPNAGTLQQPREVRVEDGHVYLVHQASWKHWILFRATLADAKAEGQAGSGAEDVSSRPAKSRSATKSTAPTKSKSAKPLTGKKKDDRVKALLDWAKANDDEEHATAAITALNELLDLDPNNAEARRLREKIRRYSSGN